MKRRQFLQVSGIGVAATAVTSSFVQAQAPNVNTMPWGSMTRAARDAAYNNAGAVSSSTQIIDGWIAASATFRSQRSTRVDLAYGPRERNKWDLFAGANPKAPCLVHIHGGYWQSRNREHFSCLAEGVLARGWSAALPGYTLAPDATLTQIVGELRSALDWLAMNGSTHGIAGPIILSGWSAGGHLAALLLDHPGVTAGLAISGIFELGPIRDTYLDQRLKLTDEEIATLSPLRLPSVGKPLAISYGTAELPALVRNSRNYHAHRAGSHRPGELIPIPNANHYTGLESLRSPDGILTRTAMRLVEDAA
jgi:arylformamidase